jgi:arabinogalactan oligomer/maltooligosaccharide transport system substrate-binding protein
MIHGPTMLKQLITFILLLLALSSCQVFRQGDDELSGRVVLWHGWTPEETAILEEALDEFREIHPQVTVASLALPKSELLEQYKLSANDGLAPDILLGSSDWVGELADAGLVRGFENDEFNALNLETGRLAATRYQNKIYGLPLSLYPSALYYNKSLVDSPPTSLDGLLEQAAEGIEVAFVPRFEEAYWGIQTLGQGLFDEEGDITLVDSGFTRWLEWLNNAQNEPGVILSADDTVLFDLFSQGRVAYYVAGPGKQALLKEVMGEESFGVVPLPSGPDGPAGPLLPVESIIFYLFSSQEQSRTAIALGDFLANQQQANRFMRELDRVPANPGVGVDSRIYPNVSGFARQARTAVIPPNELAWDQLVASGNKAYISALSGILTPAEAVCRFGQEIIDLQDLSEDEIRLPAGCEPFEAE